MAAGVGMRQKRGDAPGQGDHCSDDREYPLGFLQPLQDGVTTRSILWLLFFRRPWLMGH